MNCRLRNRRVTNLTGEKKVRNNVEIIEALSEGLLNIRKIDSKNFADVYADFANVYSVKKIETSIFGLGTLKNIVLFESCDSDLNCGDKKISTNFENDCVNVDVACYVEDSADWDCEKEKFCRLVCTMTIDAVFRIFMENFTSNFYLCDIATGLPNINAFQRFGNKLVKEKKISEYTAFLINVKGTNYLNKKMGYESTKEIFVKYAENIKKRLDDDEIISRVGEDNFALLVKKNKSKKIIKILDGTEIEIVRHGKPLSFTLRARAGVYSCDSSTETFSQVMSYVTSALKYATDVVHKDVVHCTYELDSKFAEMSEYSQNFKKSLENGDFFVVYQPKVLTTDNTIYGGEALVRWKYKGKVLQPSSYIPTLEREHLICRLDWYVLSQTCQNIRKWLDCNVEPVRISVNFSNEHLHESNFVKKVAAIVDKYNVPHKYIEIEMTETVDNEEIDRLSHYVEGLQSYGFNVAIDDFGIGYSSLFLLKKVPVDVLKIDKAFVDELAENGSTRERILLANIINMAAQLGIEVVAEGVETKNQTDMLTKLSCFRIQGYIFDKPLSEYDFYQRLIARRYEYAN